MKQIPAVVLVVLAALPGATLAQQSEREQNRADAARINVRLGVEYMRQGELAIAQEVQDQLFPHDPKGLPFLHLGDPYEEPDCFECHTGENQE